MTRNLDEFERFHQRKKRKPLADISKLQNTNKFQPYKSFTGIKISSLKQLARSAPLRKLSSGHSILQLRDVFQQKKRQAEITNEIQTKEIRGKNQNLTNGGFDQPNESLSDNSLTTTNKPTSGLNTATPHLSYSELSRSPNYNSIVAESNRAIERFTSGSRLSVGTTKTSKKEENTNSHTVWKVNHMGPFLLSVLLGEETVLLINGNKVPVQVGDYIQLGQCKTMVIDGLTRKLATSWEIVNKQ